MAGDPDFADVLFLLHFEGADASTTFTNKGSGANPTAEGNAQIDTAQFKFGGSSLLLDGVNDDIVSPDEASFDLSNNDFTIEGWVRFASSPTGLDMALASHYRDNGNIGWWFGHKSDNTLAFTYSTDGTATTVHSAAWAPSIDTWYFISVSRQSTNLYIAVDGVELGTTHNIGTSSIFAPTVELLRIGGAHVGPSLGFDFHGHIDEFRWTVGTGRYDSTTYSVPTGPFPDEFGPGDALSIPKAVGYVVTSNLANEGVNIGKATGYVVTKEIPVRRVMINQM